MSQPALFGAPSAPRLHTGTLTVVRVKDGKEQAATIRIRQQWFKDRDGEGSSSWKVIAEYLRGPNNECDYTGFAFVDPYRATYRMWKKYAGSENLRFALDLLCGDPRAASEAYAIRSGRCSRCNRVLTVPSSLHAGLGPECAKIVGY